MRAISTVSMPQRVAPSESPRGLRAIAAGQAAGAQQQRRVGAGEAAAQDQRHVAARRGRRGTDGTPAQAGSGAA